MPRKARARFDNRRRRMQNRNHHREKRRRELELKRVQLQADLEREKESEAEPLASPPTRKAVMQVPPPKLDTAQHTTAGATMMSSKSYASTPQVASTGWENHLAMAVIPHQFYGLLGVYGYVFQDPRSKIQDGAVDTRIPNVTTVASPAAKPDTSNSTSIFIPAQTETQAKEILLSHHQQQLAQTSVPLQNLATSVATNCTPTSQQGSQISKRKVAEIVDINKRCEHDVETTEAKNKENVEEKNAKDCKQLSDLEENTSNLTAKAIETGKDEERPLPRTVNDRGNGLVEVVRTLPVEKLRTMFVEKCQKLRDLRKGVLELLDFLVPEMSVPRSEMMPLDDNTVDVLLRDALDTNR